MHSGGSSGEGCFSAPRASRLSQLGQHRPSDAEDFEIKRVVCEHLEYTLCKNKFTVKGEYKNLASRLYLRDQLYDQLNEQRSQRRVYLISPEIGDQSFTSLLHNTAHTEKIAKVLEGLEAQLMCEDSAMSQGSMLLESLSTLNTLTVGYSFYTKESLHYTNRFALQPKIKFFGAVRQSMSENAVKIVWDPLETMLANTYEELVAGYDSGVPAVVRRFEAIPFEETPTEESYQDKLAKCMEVLKFAHFDRENLATSTKAFYFLASAAVQDIFSEIKKKGANIKTFIRDLKIHLLGSECFVFVLELIRILHDEFSAEFDSTLDIVRGVLSASLTKLDFQRLPLELVTKLLPRHNDLLMMLNSRWLSKCPPDLQSELSILGQSLQGQTLCPENLILFTCGRVGLPTGGVVPEALSSFYGEKLFEIEPCWASQRQLALASPQLATFISQTLGSDAWQRTPSKLRELGVLKLSPDQQSALEEARLAAKKALGQKLGKDLENSTVSLVSTFDLAVVSCFWVVLHPEPVKFRKTFLLMTDRLTEEELKQLKHLVTELSSSSSPHFVHLFHSDDPITPFALASTEFVERTSSKEPTLWYERQATAFGAINIFYDHTNIQTELAPQIETLAQGPLGSALKSLRFENLKLAACCALQEQEQEMLETKAHFQRVLESVASSADFSSDQVAQQLISSVSSHRKS